MTDELRQQLIDYFEEELYGDWDWEAWERAKAAEKESIVEAAIIEFRSEVDSEVIRELFREWANEVTVDSF